MNPLDAVTEAVEALSKAVPGLADQCTDPQGLDLAELLLGVQEARKALQAVERDVEMRAAAAMLGDQAEGGGLFVERYRSADRKAWDHEQWQRDVRIKAVQAAGMKGAQGVLTADGELLPIEELGYLLATVQAAHGAGAPKTTTLKSLGLDARDYCESSPGAWHVKVQRRVETEGGQDDAA